MDLPRRGQAHRVRAREKQPPRRRLSLRIGFPRLCQRQDRRRRNRTPRGGAFYQAPLRKLRLLRLPSRRLLGQTPERIRGVSRAEGIPSRHLPSAVHAAKPLRERLPPWHARRVPAGLRRSCGLDQTTAQTRRRVLLRRPSGLTPRCGLSWPHC